MKFNCCKCGDGMESGKDFIPIDPAGSENRRFVCTSCADFIQRQQARNALGKDGLEVTRVFNPGFLR